MASVGLWVQSSSSGSSLLLLPASRRGPGQVLLLCSILQQVNSRTWKNSSCRIQVLQQTQEDKEMLPRNISWISVVFWVRAFGPVSEARWIYLKRNPRYAAQVCHKFSMWLSEVQDLTLRRA
ncbi:unnamed protein product [Tetraodon nigroviridis]|uniref:(spotted green pufferfish) hypothetical protein n=1 Tax=Tetraodon nigroviridis TaxID=99883 RepID=Q4SQY9_TETNG|nr:unnamed protein product [Tetraodon nigroviridis]